MSVITADWMGFTPTLPEMVDIWELGKAPLSYERREVRLTNLTYLVYNYYLNALQNKSTILEMDHNTGQYNHYIVSSVEVGINGQYEATLVGIFNPWSMPLVHADQMPPVERGPMKDEWGNLI